MSIMVEGSDVVRRPLSQRRIIERLLDGETVLIEMMKEICKCLYSLPSLSREDFQKSLSSITELKGRIESIKRELLEYVSKTAPTLMYKDEWVRLVSKMAGVADKIVGVALRIEQLLNHRAEAVSEVTEDLSNFADLILSSLREMQRALNFTHVDARKALEACDKIDEIEKEIDEAYRKLNFKLLELNLPLRELILLKEITDMLEEIADTTEYAGDDLRIVLLNML